MRNLKMPSWKNSSPRLLELGLLTIGPMLLVFSFAGRASAQTTQSAPPQIADASSGMKSSISKMNSQPAATPQKEEIVNQDSRQSTFNSVKDAKPTEAATNTLNELASYYQRESERIARENAQLKELYADGLIARNELEASNKSLAEARSRVTDLQRQVEALTKPTTLRPISSTAGTWSTGNARLDALIRNQGAQYGVDPYLIYCVMSQESSFDASAVSPKGARGLMQLMPATAARYGVLNPLDPVQSIRGGTHYLKDLLELFNGRVDLALAGYNAGEAAVIKYGNRVPPYAETQSYVRLISMRYRNKNGF